MRILLGIVSIIVVFGTMVRSSPEVFAQQPQIPSLMVCNETQVKGKAVVQIHSRADLNRGGVFKISIELNCDPTGTGYPDGGFEMSIDMTDSTILGTVVSTTLEQVTSTGKHSPTAYLNGRCKAEGVSNCRFWMMLADNNGDSGGDANRRTPDIVGFLIFDPMGKRVAYGTGPVVEGDIIVGPTSF